MTSDIIRRAAAATASCQGSLALIQEALEHSRPVNGYGVYQSRGSVIADLVAIKRSAEIGIATLRATTWPTSDDYDAEEG